MPFKSLAGACYNSRAAASRFQEPQPGLAMKGNELPLLCPPVSKHVVSVTTPILLQKQDNGT